jgi:Ca-activated chloride channel family protein
VTDLNLTARQDRRLIRAIHHSTRYALVEIAAPPASAAAVRPRVNVAFVLDRSGSMSGRNKINLAKDALREGIERLASTDRFAVVVYDHEVDVVAAGRTATVDAKRDAIRALDPIGPRGNTDLGGGWLRGAEQVAQALDPEAVNRVLLLTDGLANTGITDTHELERHARELRARGVSTSTFGVGEDFNEQLLGAMADAGGGAFRYIRHEEEIPALLRSEVGELLEVTARGVDLRVRGPEGLRVECLSPYPVDRSSREAVVHVGDMVADQVVRLVLVLGFPLGDVGRDVGVELAVADRDGRLAGSATLTWTFADGEANDRQPRDRDVDHVVARMYADRAIREAVDGNRRGAWDEVRHDLLGVAHRVRAYAGDDAALRGIVAELEHQAEAWSVQRAEADRKMQFTASAYALKSRAPSGAAMRREGPPPKA